MDTKLMYKKIKNINQLTLDSKVYLKILNGDYRYQGELNEADITTNRTMIYAIKEGFIYVTDK